MGDYKQMYFTHDIQSESEYINFVFGTEIYSQRDIAENIHLVVNLQKLIVA